MAQKRTTLRGWKKPEDGKSSACRLISSFVCIFGGIKWDCSKSLTIDCAEQLRTNPSVPGEGKPAIPAKVKIRTVVIDLIFMRNATAHQLYTNPTFSFHSGYFYTKSRFPDLLET